MVSTRRSKESPGVLSQEPDIPADTQSPPQSQSPSRTKKRRRSPRTSGSQSPLSDADSPKSDSSAREKMRKTRIQEPETTAPPVAALNHNEMEEMVEEAHPGETSPGENRRKRPHDEIASTVKESKMPTADSESRSPSRAANGEPLGKKLRETPSPPRDTDETSVSTKDASENSEVKSPKEELKAQPGGGFSNTSSMSPFGSLASQATSKTTTNKSNGAQSGFAASKFSSFAKATSAFGVSPSPLGPSPFAGPPSGPDNVFTKMSSSSAQSVFPTASLGTTNVFAAMSGKTGTSGFGTSASSLGSGGSIFGNPLVAKSLPKAQLLEGIKKSEKSEMGDPDSENDGSGDEGAEGKVNWDVGGSNSAGSVPKVAFKSGEEDYDMVFQARAKLFELSEGAWKERGIGNIRVLVPKPEEEFDEADLSRKPTVGRIVMRQEGVGRLILNANMFKGMLASGKAMSESTIRFMAVNNVAFGETQEASKTKESENGKTTNKDDNGSTNKPDEVRSAPGSESSLKAYLLRFKNVDLVNGFKDHVTGNLPA